MTARKIHKRDESIGAWPLCGTFSHGALTDDWRRVTCLHCQKRRPSWWSRLIGRKP